MAGSLSTTQKKNPCSCTKITIFSFPCLILLLITILIAFNKRELGPILYLYRDVYYSRSPNLSSSSVLTFPSQSPECTPHYGKSTNASSFSIGFGIRQSPAHTPHYDKSPNASSLPIGFEIPISAPESANSSESGYESVSKTTMVEYEACNLYVGSWVKDNTNYPLYRPGSCPYVDEAFDCQINGRRDFEYLKWRWKPDACELPRFNATDFLVRLRGKRLMLVGDSMNRNQFESLLCLLHEDLLYKSRMYEVHGYKITKGRGSYIFKFEDYNCTVEFVRSHFLVKEGIRINGQGNSNPILSIDQIDKSAERWKRADILIFNTGHWWAHGKTAKGKNYYKEGDYLYPKFDSVEAYRRALKTWAKWVDTNLDPAQKLIFYRGYSSAHFRGGDWDSGGSCNGETEPLLNGANAFLDEYPMKMKIVEEVIQEMQFPVILLNVTRLTKFRKDGHPSIYGKKNAGSDGRKVPVRRQDCSHWCLPGVPDSWNELIYATLVFQQTSTRSH